MWILEGCAVWESPGESPLGRITFPQRSRGAGWRREGDPEKYSGTLWGLRCVALQGSHQIRNVGVKAQLDSVMTL